MVKNLCGVDELYLGILEEIFGDSEDLTMSSVAFAW